MIWLLISKSLNKSQFLQKTLENYFLHLCTYFCNPLAKTYIFYDLAWLSPNNPLRFNISMETCNFKSYFQILLSVFHQFSLCIRKLLHLHCIIISTYMSVLLSVWGRETHKWNSPGRALCFTCALNLSQTTVPCTMFVNWRKALWTIY